MFKKAKHWDTFLSHCIIAFNSTSPDQLTFKSIITCLLNKETCQKSPPINSLISTWSSNTNNIAMAALVAQFKKAGGDFSQCFFCDKPSHIKANCIERKKWEEQRTKDLVNVAELESNSDNEFAL